MEAKKQAHVSEKKKISVKRIEALLKEYPNVGIVNMSTLPCASLQKMRKQLADKLVIFVAKKRLIKLALESVKKERKGIEKLEAHLGGIPGLIFTKESPFRIYKTIQKSKSKALAKAGQLAPFELVIPAGPTQFGPGPVIGELGQLGIKTAIEGGKITIKNDFVAAKKGAVITDKVAGLLAKFNIAPMEIGLNVVAIYENGDVFSSDVLGVDEQQYIDNITRASSWAFNLSVESCYVTKQNADLIIANASRGAKAVAIEFGILEKDVVDAVLSKVNAQAMGLKKEFNI